MPGSTPPLVVGFDLDMTLVDSRPGIVTTLHALADEIDAPGPAAAEATVLRDPGLLPVLLASTLDRELERRFPGPRATELADRFRVLYADVGVRGTTLVPGAEAAIAHVRARGGRVVVVTAKYEPNARRCLDHVGLVTDAVHGWLHGPEKAAALRAEGATVYVGDTVHDVEAAHHADAIAVAVTTGTHSPAELRAAGAHAVLASLTELPAWWATDGRALGLTD